MDGQGRDIDESSTTTFWNVFLIPYRLLFAVQTDKIIGIPDEPPAIVRLSQHLHHRADGHRHLIILLG